MILTKGTIIRMDEQLHRVIYVDRVNDVCFMIHLSKNELPLAYTLSDLQARLAEEDITVEQTDPTALNVDEKELTMKERAIRDKAYAIVKSILVEPNIYYKDTRGQLIKEASAKYQVAEKTIREYLKRYWQRGLTANALLPNFYKCGKSPRQYQTKVGRRTKYETAIKRGIVTEQWKKIFKKSFEKYYLVMKQTTLKFCYEQMLKDYFSIEHPQTGVKMLNVEEPIPSFRQFQYWVQKTYDHSIIARKREGYRYFMQNHRPTLGSTVQDSGSVGQFAIDVTVADIYLCNPLQRSEVVGRPIVYLTVDVFSRMIVGVYATFENASKQALRNALIHTFMEKSLLYKDLGISNEQWPAHYLGNCLICDRGSEFISAELTFIAEQLNITVQNTGAYRAEMKSVVESYFQIVQSHLAGMLPGVVRKDFQKRGNVQPKDSAILTLKEYSDVLIKSAVHINQRVLKNYPMTLSMIESDLYPTPQNIFEHELKTTLLRTLTKNQLSALLLPYAKASVTPKGIAFRGLYYMSELALNEKWYSDARIAGSKQVDIQYNEDDVSVIYLRHDRQTVECCSLLNQFEQFKGLTFAEYEGWRSRQRKQIKSHEEQEMNVRLQLAQEIENIVQQAKANAELEEVHAPVEVLEDYDTSMLHLLKRMQVRNDENI